MRDSEKTKEQLLRELSELRRRVEKLEALQSGKGEPAADAKDASQRKKAESERDRAEAMLKAAIECLPFTFYAVGTDGRYILQNTASRENYGDALGKTPEEVCPDQRDLAFWLDNRRRAFAGERVEREVTYTIHGEQRHFFTVATPIEDANEFYGSMGVNVDITQRKRTEDALRDSEARFRRLFQDSAVAGVVVGPDSRFRQVNRAFCRYLGYAEEELLGRTVQSVTHPDDCEETSRSVRQALASGPHTQRFEKRYLTKSGQVVWGEVQFSLVCDPEGNPDYFITQVLDITERKRAEQALRQAHNELEQRVRDRTAELSRSEAKYRQLVETTDTGYLILDEEGRVADANVEYVRISGHHGLEEIVGRSVVQWTAPGDLDRNAREVEKCLQTGSVRQLEVDYVHADGTIIPVEINATCIDSKEGRRILSLCRDISERRRAEEALERERQTLWHMLQASDHERQLIAYEIHDGLAQYLAAAAMQLQVFEHLRTHDPEQARAACEAAVQLVKQAHNESRRLISGVRPPVLDEAGVETAIAHLVHDERVFKGLKIELQSEVEFDRLPNILENALYRIAQEALTNAWKHSQSNKVGVRLLQKDGMIRLEVQDWGIGFDPRSIAEGHFGLEGIRERVRLLGGELTIDSGPGRGTLIRVEVPLLERDASAGQ